MSKSHEEILDSIILKEEVKEVERSHPFVEADEIKKFLRSHRAEARELVKGIFKNDNGTPVILTDKQCDLFNIIYRRITPRVHVATFTRWGKSRTIAFAVLLRASTFPEKWAIVAGNQKQAAIIMNYVIQHIFDHDYMKQKFLMEKGETEESIRRYKNKDRVNFVIRKENDKLIMGEIFITNAKGALGFGAENVVGDEMALVSDQDEALVARMLGDNPEDNFYVKVGNPWESGHFRKSYKDPRYFKLIVDYKEGIREGRITQDQVDEAQGKPFFNVLYECKFPDEGAMDDKGWLPLLTIPEIDKALVDDGEHFGVNKLGVDVAGGGKNFTVMLRRSTNLARILVKNRDSDTMNQAERIINLRKSEKIKPDDIGIDKVGIGKGLYDILNRELEGLHGINPGEKPIGEMDQELYINVRAMMFWRLREWVLKGGKLVKGHEPLDATWYQLSTVKYNKKLEGRRGKMQVMPKELMIKEGIESPDVADALALTFYTDDIMRSEALIQNVESYDEHGLFPEI